MGEPPLFLAASVFFAIKEAIKSARIDAGFSPEFVLEAPATCAKIRMACEDHITDQVIQQAQNIKVVVLSLQSQLITHIPYPYKGKLRGRIEMSLCCFVLSKDINILFE